LAPTGREIGITGGDGRIRDIHVLNVDGSGLRKLIYSRGVQNDDPQWSPDGRKIAFSRLDRERRSWIFVMNADGSDQTNISRNHADDGAPAWSPAINSRNPSA
jgi:TolB protein